MRQGLQDQRTGKPAAGQVWRLRGTRDDDDRIELAAIIRAEGDLLVAPVTMDQRESTDHWTLQAMLESVAISVWVGLQCFMPRQALDVLLGRVPAGGLLAVHHAFRRGNEPPRSWPLGRQPDSELLAHRDKDDFVPCTNCAA